MMADYSLIVTNYDVIYIIHFFFVLAGNVTVELPHNQSERVIKIRPAVMLTFNCSQRIDAIIMAGGGAVSNIMVEWLLVVIKVDGTFDDSQQTVTNSIDGYVIVLCVHSWFDLFLSFTHIEFMYHQMVVC